MPLVNKVSPGKGCSWSLFITEFNGRESERNRPSTNSVPVDSSGVLGRTTSLSQVGGFYEKVWAQTFGLDEKFQTGRDVRAALESVCSITLEHTSSKSGAEGQTLGQMDGHTQARSRPGHNEVGTPVLSYGIRAFSIYNAPIKQDLL